MARLADILAILKAAGEDTRLRLLALMAESELTVSEIVAILGQSQPRISRHLRLLCEAGLLARFQEGTWVFYRLTTHALLQTILKSIDDNDPQRRLDRAGLERVRADRNVKMQAYFAKNAASWAEIRALYVAEEEVEASLQALLQDWHDRQDLRLLDVGTGTGRMLEIFASLANDAIGLDVSKDMLAFARARLDGRAYAHCQLRLGDMYHLPFADGARDLIFFHQVLHFAGEPARAIKEAGRVMAPKGRLLIVDFTPHAMEILRDTHAHRRLGFASDEMEEMAFNAGLALKEKRFLQGGQIEVGVWCFEKENKS